MKMSKLSNQTNSQDPQAVNSRIFVGNLNTFQCSKTDVERMFQIYGRLAGISMHKGYAFVQFTNPFDARNACLGEDGKTILSQTLDVNMVAEPKPHQIGRKRQNVNKTGNDWDYFYDSYCSSAMTYSNGMRPKKRKRLMSNSSRMVSLSDAVNSGNLNAAVAAAAVAQQQQQQLHQQQQQHHQHQQQTQQQQQVAAVAMAAMANLLPQQQLLLHQQSLLSNANGAITSAAAAACNGATTTPHHTNLGIYLQQQQQQQHLKQQQAAAAAVAVAAQYAAATNGSLQLKMSSPLINGSLTNQPSSNSSSLVSTHNAGNSVADQQAILANQPHLLQHQQPQPSNIMQPLALSLSPQHQTQQQQQQKQHTHTKQQQVHLLQSQNHHQSSLPTLSSSSSQLQIQAVLQQQHEQLTINQQWGPFKVYSNPDTLICGNCRECFNELAELLDHKRSYCKLRFTCKCQDLTINATNPPSGAKLLCAMCKDAFINPWDLMVHAQAAHMVNIYELSNEPSNNNELSGDSNRNRNNSNVDIDSNLTVNKSSNANDLTCSNIKNSSNKNNNNNNNNRNNNNSSSNNNYNNNNNNDNDSNNNNNTKNHNNGIQLSLVKPAPAPSPVIPEAIAISNSTAPYIRNKTELSSAKPTATTTTTITQSSILDNINRTDASIMLNNDNGNSCNNSLVGDGSISDSEANLSMELKFGICNSPNGSVSVKEDTHRDDGSLDGGMSYSSQTHHSDDVKMLNNNGSLSSGGSSPALDTDETIAQPQKACIVRTLSIETTTAGTSSVPPAAIGLIPNSLALSLTNGTTAKAAAAPQ
uniref:RRM domain-containing protein n=1 Tax=Glossina brevipalpis TaxID=37001 RepID=A0A1A9WD11_9MUSC